MDKCDAKDKVITHAYALHVEFLSMPRLSSPERHSEPTLPTLSHASRPSSLIIAALGVVYGDIGTSPLYSLRECFNPIHGISLSAQNVYGVLSLIFWSLTLVVSIKYLATILKADNHGEGGIMALVALILRLTRGDKKKPRRKLMIYIGIFGAALLYGDGIITPAISVLSAVEGLQVATPAFQSWVVPITVFVLILIFSVQHRGTSKVGAVFGPAMLCWFLVISIIAVPWIVKHPEILQSVNPFYGFDFFYRNGKIGFFTLSSVVLCITGAEALYADMGHFGKHPIQIGWFSIVSPALFINYFGQGAYILDRGQEALKNPFFGLVDGWLVYPLVFLATIATIIASQALISGAYSLTQQAIQLGYFPRTQIEHTSKEAQGQIYVSRVNQFLMIGSISLVILFRHSTKLAAAYGIAVTGTMMITSILFYEVARHQWKWKPSLVLLLVGIFLIMDTAFFLANIKKLIEGGWIPLVIALGIFIIMTTWRHGRDALAKVTVATSKPLEEFFTVNFRKKPVRIAGTAIFMTVSENVAPPVLLHHLKHNQVLHEKVILLSIRSESQPQVTPENRVKIIELERGFFSVVAYFGYMEKPDISEVLIFCLGQGLDLDINELNFYLGRETVLTDGNSSMMFWRKKLFIFLSRNARPATDYFSIPANQVIEIGYQVSI
jgi:KUP system potassium uptake protein